MTWHVPARIETERLVLRRYEAADAEALAATVARNIDHLARYMEWIAFEPQSVEQRRAWIEDVNAQAEAGTEFVLGMFDHAGTLVGGTGFHVGTDPERLMIGYWIDAAHQGAGLVTEASAALARVALELAGAAIVDISHAASNARSAAVPARLGFTRRETCGEACFDGGTKEPGVTWWATREALASGPLASTPRPAAFDADGAERAWPA
ncbi:GNAT family N-acetyltransferase [Demequina mangrovi]|uniref:Protein N-acetyltransferase, RimJ/RimL family n=1 Tax=Demequina mangrovi TaxID=1043493 RepID=A0A1H6ZH53_9MICO|nr:GNAT family N-acetyltransferase [Demequina mangrovi]SEJ48175.1 Protein N-acetyltransferase, RimJ/RimL family [Demequina mangrovi]